MDPYIEAWGFWEDFHHGLIARIADALGQNLPEKYVARTKERANIVCEEIAKEFKEFFVEIYEFQPERRLVTCIEVLSPSNKRPSTPGWDLYQRKRQALLLGEANLVEIDLLRTGTKMPMLDSWPRSAYALLVSRRDSSGYCRVWPASYDRPLPRIPVPLSAPDPDLVLDLQPMVAEIYALRGYSQDIDYTKPLQPPLSEEEN
jgi:hypothetical protein